MTSAPPSSDAVGTSAVMRSWLICLSYDCGFDVAAP
jgi:hypothetical protein